MSTVTPKDIEYLKKNLDNNDLEEAILRLKNGEAIQYIVGNVDFYGNKLIVNKNVLIPRFETETLVEKTINFAKKMFKEKISILDIGTGSGAIAITLKKKLDCTVVASDISPEALTVAKENAKNNYTDITFVQSDLFSNINGVFDIIISNPPYLSYDEEIMDVVKNNEPHIALYAKNNGLYYYDEILKNIKKYLKDNFLIAFEIGYKQALDIKRMAHKYLDNIEVIIDKDLSGKDRYIFIKKKD